MDIDLESEEGKIWTTRLNAYLQFHNLPLNWNSLDDTIAIYYKSEDEDSDYDDSDKSDSPTKPLNYGNTDHYYNKFIEFERCFAPRILTFFLLVYILFIMGEEFITWFWGKVYDDYFSNKVHVGIWGLLEAADIIEGLLERYNQASSGQLQLLPQKVVPSYISLGMSAWHTKEFSFSLQTDLPYLLCKRETNSALISSLPPIFSIGLSSELDPKNIFLDDVFHKFILVFILYAPQFSITGSAPAFARGLHLLLNYFISNRPATALEMLAWLVIRDFNIDKIKEIDQFFMSLPGDRKDENSLHLYREMVNDFSTLIKARLVKTFVVGSLAEHDMSIEQGIKNLARPLFQECEFIKNRNVYLEDNNKRWRWIL